MNKILILGNSGSGKSTLGKSISNKLNIDLYFLDKFVYEYSWDKPNYDNLENNLKDIMLKDKYILDGNFLDRSINRFNEADTIIFLDIGPFTCLKSVIDRKKAYNNKYRESRSSELKERITLSYIFWVLVKFYISYRPKIIKIIKSHPSTNTIILKSRKEITSFINSL